MSKKLLGIGDVYTYDYKQVHKTRNVGFGYYDPNKVSTTSSTDGYVLVDGVLSVVNEDGGSEPGPGPEPPTPSLPSYTLRLKFKEGITPSFSKGTGVLVDSENNIWDLTYENSDWSKLLFSQSNLLEVIDGNTTGVTNMGQIFSYCSLLTTVSLFDTSSVTAMYSMFYDCGSLTSVPLFKTHNVTNAYQMFGRCSSLTTVPLFDTSSLTSMTNMFTDCRLLTIVPLFNTSNVTTMDNMFASCRNVQSGALALYQQASTQSTPPTNHAATFRYCGSNTETGAAELAQIPDDWK